MSEPAEPEISFPHDGEAYGDAIIGDDGELVYPLGKPKRKSVSGSRTLRVAALTLGLLAGFTIGAGAAVVLLTQPNRVVSPDLPTLSAAEYKNRGLTSRIAGDYQLALEDYNHALELAPDDAGTYVNRGHLYYLVQEDDLALADFNHALELDPSYAMVYNNRGELRFRRLADNAGALADFNRAIELDPASSLPYNNRGNLYQSENNFAQAIADYNRAVELQPTYFEAITNRATAYLKMGNMDAALSDANAAIAINPSFAKAYGTRGSVYLTQGRNEEALSDLREFVRLGEGTERPEVLNQVYEIIRQLEGATEQSVAS